MFMRIGALLIGLVLILQPVVDLASVTPIADLEVALLPPPDIRILNRSFGPAIDTPDQLPLGQSYATLSTRVILNSFGSPASPLFSCSDVIDVPQTECQALVDLYNSTDGSSWTVDYGWLALDQVCNWYGVTCFITDDGGHVGYLELPVNNLRGTLPASLGNLSRLEILRLEFNHLSGSIPKELGKLTYLKQLDLTARMTEPRVGVTGAIPKELGNLANLQRLTLTQSRLSGSIPPELGKLRQLQQLDIYNNFLTGSIPSSLGNMTQLTGLNLGANQLTGKIPTTLGNLRELRGLNLEWNQLSGELPQELTNLSNLVGLSVYHNQLSGPLPSGLGALSHLQSLDVGHNWGFSGPLPRSLMNLHELRDFYFLYTNLCVPSDADFREWLAAVPYVTSSNLDCTANNNIGGRIVDGFGDAVAGVQVAISGEGVSSTDTRGYYGALGVQAGTHTIKPSKIGYTFSPSSRTVTVPPDAEVNFVGTATTYVATGVVTDATGAGILGVTISGGGRSVVTGSSGGYTLEGLPAGTHTLTASKKGYAFTPASQPVAVPPNNLGINFVGTMTTFVVTGVVEGETGEGIPGVTMSGGGRTAVTGSSGGYILEGLSAGTHTLTPSKTGYAFAPASQPVTVPPNNLGINFVGTVVSGSYSVEGRVVDGEGNGLSNVTITVGTARVTATHDDGTYRMTGLPPGTFHVIPTRAGYSFLPYSCILTVPRDSTCPDFTGTAFTITDLEVNQVLGRQYQDQKKYVAGKATAIRAFLSAPVIVDPLRQWVEVRRNGSYVTTLQPTEPAGTSAKTLTFLCPSSQACADWEAGAYTFTANVNGLLILKAFTFQPSRDLRILAIPVKVNDNGQERTPDEMWATAFFYLRQVYPVGEKNLIWEPWDQGVLDGTEYNLSDESRFCPPFSKSGRCKLWDRLAVEQASFCGVPGRPECWDVIIGFIPDMTGVTLGWTIGEPAVVVQANADVGHIAAHEIGHNYGLGDEYDDLCGMFECSVNPPPSSYTGARNLLDLVGSCSATCSDPAIEEGPWPGTGSLVSATQDHPFELIPENAHEDARGAIDHDMVSFMGNDTHPGYDWVTPRAYSHLFDELLPTEASYFAVQQTGRVAEVSGWIGYDDSVAFEPSYALTTSLPAPAPGLYRIEALDTANNVIAGQSFDLSFVSSENPPYVLDSVPFRVPVQFPADTAAFQLLKGEMMLSVLPVSSHTPSIAVTAPGAGESVSGPTLITWNSSDADGGALYHTIEYSHDGADWSVIAAQVTDAQYLVDFDALPGGEQARVRVIVSDGINTAEAIGGPFAVSVKPPDVAIVRPGDGGVYAPGEIVTLAGTGNDPQDGLLYSSGALEWISDRDGPIGGGGIVNTNALSPGPHVISLVATNNHGLSRSASVRVFVGNELYLPLVVQGF